jgi:uncharacterized protein (DUF302 family)
MMKILTTWVLMLFMGCALAGGEPLGKEPSIRIYTSEESFEDVIENIKMAIIDRGMLVSGTLHVSDMLNRTAPDLGFTEVFSQAESVEFCSALISHKMAKLAPENIVICPFTIAAYVRWGHPGQVYVAYRLPILAGDEDGVTADIIELLDGIVQDAI